jgi:hypothetical protein
VFRRAFMAEVTRTIAAAGLRSEAAVVERTGADLITDEVGWPAQPASRSSWGR